MKMGNSVLGVNDDNWQHREIRSEVVEAGKEKRAKQHGRDQGRQHRFENDERNCSRFSKNRRYTWYRYQAAEQNSTNLAQNGLPAILVRSSLDVLASCSFYNHWGNEVPRLVSG